jgi:hypothetical protein
VVHLSGRSSYDQLAAQHEDEIHMDEIPMSDRPQPTSPRRAKIIALSFFVGMVLGGVATALAFNAVHLSLEQVDDELAGWIGVSLAILGTFVGGVVGVIVGERLSRSV